MKLISIHADGGQHREWTEVQNTIEPFSFYIPANTMVKESSGVHWSSNYPVIACFYPGTFYQVFILLKSNMTHYYCNIITPAMFTPSHVSFIDLDLDMIVDEEGARIVDEDEFTGRSSAYNTEWRKQAIEAKNKLWRLHQEQKGPFSENTVARWRDWVSRTMLHLKL